MENSRNNWLVGLISNGEGWHKNHHADQRSAAHGHRWWELDVIFHPDPRQGRGARRGPAIHSAIVAAVAASTAAAKASR